MMILEQREGPATVVLRSDPIETVLGDSAFDAVVSSDDSDLSMSGGMSKLLARMAGPIMVEEARRNAPYAVGTVVTSSAGDLPLRYILHAVTVDRTAQILPTERTIVELARAIFVQCETLRIRRVALPAIEAGAAAFDAQRSASLVLGVLRQHLRDRSILERVVFALPGSEEYLTALGVDESSPDEMRIRRDVRRLYGDSSELSGAMGPVRGTPVARHWWTFWRRASPPQTTPEGPECRVGDTPYVDAMAPVLEAHPVLNHRYVLLEQIGRGGMGIVHLAWDLVLRKVVAIKTLRSELCSSGALDLLRQEASTAMELTHENIVRFYHFEPSLGVCGPFIVMEYVDWASGEKWIANSGATRLPVGAVVAVGQQLCRALAYAHDRGFLHNDIKPGNVFVDQAAQRAKLADFGLARVMAKDSQALLALWPFGTPAYMAPEQREPVAKLGPHTDIYQLGATLWDFLTGVRPDRERVMPDGIENRRRDLLMVVKKAMATDPAERPRQVEEFAAMLRG